MARFSLARRQRPGALGTALGITCCLVPLAGSCSAAATGPENLAPKARITATSEYSEAYLARFVADGKIPDAGCCQDVGEAWAVQGITHRGGADLLFEWDEPVTIAQVIYFARMAWEAEEGWKEYEVTLDDGATPALKGQLEVTPDGQAITLPAPVKARKLLLHFTSSYGGSNPGASEVQVFAAALPPPPPPRESLLRGEMLSGRLGFRSLLVVQRRDLNPSHVYTYHVEGFRPGGGLYVFTPTEGEPPAQPGTRGNGSAGASPSDAVLRELVASPRGQILDCDLSFDGRQVLFSWRESEASTYHVYRISVDGTGLEQVTQGAWHDFNACWLPDGGIAFLSTREPAFAYCWTSPVGRLYRMDRDGGNVRRLSANYLNDFTPSVLDDGRLVYSRWEYVDRPAIPIQSLWTIEPDGTGLRVFYGNRVLSPATFMEPRSIPGGRGVLCIMTAHNGPCRGAVGIIEPGYGVNAQGAIRNLTPEVAIGKVGTGNGNFVRGPYENPYPVDSRCFLVSKRGSILLRSYDGEDACILLRPRGGLGFYNPTPLRPRPAPPVRASTLPADAGPYATVYLQDVYDGLGPQVKRGEVKQIAVVQEVEKSQLASLDRRAFDFQFPVVSCGATYAPKRVWGTVPVGEDGSAAFRVPAGVPLYFMALDAHGRALQRMRSFTHFAPGETQGCVGCHEPRSRAPLRRPLALAAYRSRPRMLTPPEWGAGGFSYTSVVQPVLDRHCVRCHNALDAPKGVDLSGDLTDFFNVSYETLARENRSDGKRFTSWISTLNGNEANILQIAPRAWGSPASLVADLVLSGHPDAEGQQRVQVDDAGRRRLFAWIDLNVPYYATSRFVYGDREGCRSLRPTNLAEVLQSVEARRCVSCHAVPRKAWVRVTHPEWNSFLAAPLARTAGGTERCGKPVFASKEDPDYQAILRTFDPVLALLKEKPREDVAGFGVQGSGPASNDARHGPRSAQGQEREERLD